MLKLAKQAILISLVGWLGASATAQQQRTAEAFESYIATAERRLIQERSRTSSFLSIDSASTTRHDELLTRLRRGDVVIEKQGATPTVIPGGLIHDWVGLVLIPKVTVARVLALVQDYDHSSRYYAPDVTQSQLISRTANDFKVFLRLKKHKIITVVLDTEYAVHYDRIDSAHQFSFSRSTRIIEVVDAGTAGEHHVQTGKDHGFMWRLNSYWAFEQVDEGVVVECEAISLTRNIPSGLGWMIGPFVNSIPRESLEFTLDATRNALKHQEH